MQGAALHVFRARCFPTLAFGETRATEYQAGLLPDSDDDPSTKVTLQGLSDHPEFERYLCEHQELREIDAVWRRNDISSLTMRFRFHIFRHTERRDLLFARGNRRIVRGAIRRLNAIKRDPPDFDIGFDPVDIRAFAAALKVRRATLHAAYFSDLTLRRVKAATLYGEDVDESDEYSHLDNAGVLSAVMLDGGGITEKFLVTQRRTIVTYRRNEERSMLTRALAINALIEEVLPQGPDPQSA